jgi:hypothetical protein
MAVYRARCGYSGAILVLKGYSKEEMNQQSQHRVWNEVQVLQVHCEFFTMKNILPMVLIVHTVQSILNPVLW